METLKEKFKKFVYSEESLFNLDILVDEFDFTIPDCIERFYYELFRNPATSKKVKGGWIKLTLEAPFKETGEILYFNAVFDMETLKEIKLEFAKNYKRQIQELRSLFNIFFVLNGLIDYDKDRIHLENLGNVCKFGIFGFGWLKFRYDDVLFFPLEDFKFSYFSIKDMKVL